MGKIYAVANQKGGVAKSTTTYNLACAKALEGYKVCMIDFDPQYDLTTLVGYNDEMPEFDGHNICDFLKGRPDECVFSIDALAGTAVENNLFIVPSTIDLAVMETGFVVDRKGSWRMKKAVDVIRDDYDYIFIDCPPNLGILLMNALIAADEVIIPVKTDELPYKALKALYTNIEEVQADEMYNADLKVAGIVPTFFESRVKKHNEILQRLNSFAAEIGTRVFEPIKKTDNVNKGIEKGLPIVLNMKSQDAAKAYIKIAESI